MKYHLILCTLNRDLQTVQEFLDSVACPSDSEVSVWLVDQNEDDRLAAAKFNGGKLTRLRSRPGLSAARNLGIRQVLKECRFDISEVISFPDDDCLYRSTTLDTVKRFLETKPGVGGVSGRSIDRSGKTSILRWPSSAERLERSKIFTQAISISIFLRSELVRDVGQFDESMGAGAGTPFGSGEETDFLLRALFMGFQIEYRPEVEVVHENPKIDKSSSLGRATFYGQGLGNVLRKHKFAGREVLPFLVRPALGGVVRLAQGRINEAKFHAEVFKGRWRGFRGKAK